MTCWSCGYDLGGCAAPVCPECGRAVRDLHSAIDGRMVRRRRAAWYTVGFLSLGVTVFVLGLLWLAMVCD